METETGPEILTEILIEARDWERVGLQALAARASGGVAQALLLSEHFEISLLACDDARIATLNESFRGKEEPTNVLSWPSVDLGAEEDGAMPDIASAEAELGDIAIAFETCAREAMEQDKSLSDHSVHLLVHGILHLFGFDHIRPKDADLMEGLESRILAKLGISDPYGP